MIEAKFKNSEELCSICLDYGIDQPTTCGHVFHKECLTQWLKTQKVCPECREKLI